MLVRKIETAVRRSRPALDSDSFFLLEVTVKRTPLYFLVSNMVLTGEIFHHLGYGIIDWILVYCKPKNLAFNIMSHLQKSITSKTRAVVIGGEWDVSRRNYACLGWHLLHMGCSIFRTRWRRRQRYIIRIRWLEWRRRVCNLCLKKLLLFSLLK